MLGSLSVFVKFGLLFLFAAIFLVAAFAFAKIVLASALAARSVQIGTFQDPQGHDVKSYLLARAEELADPVPLDTLFEVRVPPLQTGFGAKDDYLTFFNDVKINIQGVDVPAVIKALFAALPDDQAVVSAEVVGGAGGSTVRMEWKEPSGKKKTWLLRSEKTADDATRDIVDQAIYKMFYYQQYEREAPRAPEKRGEFSSERTLTAYYSGQQSLAAYQRKHGRTDAPSGQKPADDGQADLDQAEKQFRVLQQEMPNFIDGLMLLGITLWKRRASLRRSRSSNRSSKNSGGTRNRSSKRKTRDSGMSSKRLSLNNRKRCSARCCFARSPNESYIE